MKNSERAARVEGVLIGYAGEAEDSEANLNDLMTDLRHWCHASEMDFDKAVKASQYHFAAEMLEEESSDDDPA